MTPAVDDPLKPFDKIHHPDDRQAFFVGTLEDLHLALSAVVLKEIVPWHIVQSFETAKNVRLYAFFAYRFHQVAEMVLYQTLEMALKTRWRNERAARASAVEGKNNGPGLSNLLKMAADRRWIFNDGFTMRSERARNALQSEKMAAALSSNDRVGDLVVVQEPTAEEIVLRAPEIDVISLLSKHIPKFRNDLAHGSSRLNPLKMMLFYDVRDAVNMTFDLPPASVRPQQALAARNSRG